MGADLHNCKGCTSATVLSDPEAVSYSCTGKYSSHAGDSCQAGFLAALSLYAAAGSISCKKVFWYAERWTVLFPDHVHAGAFRIHG